MNMKCVLIIGGNCDLGRELCSYFLEKNYQVIVGYHKDNCKYFKEVRYMKCDVKKISDIENIIIETKKMYGDISILINMACVYMDNNFLDKTKEEFMDVLEVNLVGTFLCSQIYSRYIDDGMIINIASTDGIDTYSQYSIDYSASKAGIINMSRSISLSTSNRVLCICPNWIDTSSTRNMNREYLDSELVRIGQSRLITMDEFVFGFDKIISGQFNSGDVFRIDIKGDKLWVEKM